MMSDGLLLQVGVWAAAYALAFIGSTHVVGYVLTIAGKHQQHAGDDHDARLITVTADDREIGNIIGKLENFLIVTFVIVQAYAALAIIVGAKGLIRRHTGLSESYVVIGTLANLSWSLLVACSARLVIHVSQAG